MKALNWLAILAIWFYQRTVSRYLYRARMRCLHHPSCSQYGILAFKKHKFSKATL